MCIIFYTVYVKFYLIWYRIPFYTFAEHMHTSTCSLYFFIRRYVTLYDDTSHYTRYVTLYDDTSHYTTIRHIICLKTVHYIYKRTVLKVRCYQNIFAEKHGRNLHVLIFIGDNHGE